MDRIKEIIDDEVVNEENKSYTEAINSVIRKVRCVNNERLVYDIEHRDNDLLKKIEGRREKLDEDTQKEWTVDIYLEKLREDRMFQEEFVISVTTQGLYERTQLVWLAKRTKEYSTMEKSKNVWYLSASADLKSRADSKKTPTDCKTFDGEFNGNSFSFLKHTNIDGGAQDNQRADVVKTIELVVTWLQKAETDKTRKVLFILDGAYYIKDVNRAGVTRIEDLQEMIPSSLKTESSSLVAKNSQFKT
jgi:hypothetical protein